jgi:lipoprotein-releasing system permease protein
MEWFLALRHLRPRRTFVSVITILSILGVTLGVMVPIVVLSVMAGFEQELEKKIIGFNAHLTLLSDETLKDPDRQIAKLLQEPEIAGASAYVRGPVLVRFKNRVTTPAIKGIDPEGEELVTPTKPYLVAGEYELRGDTVVVGQEWARRNGAFVGDKLLIYAPRHFEALLQDKKVDTSAILPDEMLITGIFQTGHFEHDLNYILTSLENGQRLYNLGPNAHGISIRLKPAYNAPEKIREVQKRWRAHYPPPLYLLSWMDQNAAQFNAIATERVVMTFILFFVMLVAGFGLCSTMITITVKKSGEIGLLKALGARDSQVLVIFILHGFIVGVIGATLGVIFALLALHYRNPFRHWLLERFKQDVFSADIYSFPFIPASTNPWLVVLIAISGVMICVLAALIPAFLASRLAPARALHYE